MLALLEGIRVIDLARIIAGPYAAQTLAVLGADVIKVEPPSGDPAREIGPKVDDQSLYFASVNTGKRGVVLDLKTPEGREDLDLLIASADVVIENFRPAVRSRLGLEPSELVDAHPRLVVVSVPGYSHLSDRADEPAYDLVVQAEAGVMSLTGEAGHPPLRAGVPIGDLAAGLWATIVALAGVVKRLSAGTGGWMEVPLLDATLSTLSYVGSIAAGMGVDPGPVGSGHHLEVPYGAFPTLDGWMAVAVIGEKYWDSIATILPRPDLATLRTPMERLARRADIEKAVAELLRDLTQEEASEMLTRAGVPHAPVLSVLEAMNTAYVRRMGLVRHLDGRPSYQVITGPVVTERALRPAPYLGEHNDEVFAELKSDV